MSSYAALDLNASDGPVKPIEEEQARSSRLRATVALLAVVAVSLVRSHVQAGCWELLPCTFIAKPMSR